MRLIILIVICLIFVIIAYADEHQIGFIEDFSLSKNRNDALKQLIPGTEDYYYFHCLNAQHEKDAETVRKLSEQWIKQHGYTERLKEILNRQALLDYDKHPKKSLEHIRNELDLRFDHQKEVSGPKSDIPSELAPETIAFANLLQQAFSRYENLDGIEDAGLELLPHEKLDPTRRRELLRRMQRPDIAGLPNLVVDDLKHKDSGGFGSFPIHFQMLKSQLEECVKLMPELADNSNFVRAYLSKLAPSEDTDIRYDAKEKRAYLERLWNYTKTLSPVHNSLKIHVLYAILDLNRREGNYDEALFSEYVKLPRNAGYLRAEYLNQPEFRKSLADMNVDFGNFTRLPKIGSDEELVRDYLSHFFIKAENYKAYTQYIQEDFLKAVFAETKIVNEIGDMNSWYSLMTPSRYQALKDRVDIDFALTGKEIYSADDPVSLDVYIKNVKTLIVKVFEINAFNYYTAKNDEVDTAIALDGLTASYETVINYDETPFKRVLRKFPFEQLKNPGVYVIELIGSGKSSRALIRKGKLYALGKIGPAGHEFTIIDDKRQKHPKAVIWLKSRQYSPDKDGVIIIPFSTQPAQESFVIQDGNYCDLGHFQHLGENYQLSAGFYADRESLLSGMTAKLLIRPVLRINGQPTSLSVLEDIRLSMESSDYEGISSSRDIPDVKLFEDKETIVDFQVPKRLSQIRFTLKAKVKNISRDKTEDLADSAEFRLNGIEQSLHSEDMFLSHNDNSYLIEILGKNGEIKAYRSVSLELKQKYFRDTIPVTLQSDAKGRIHLGKLQDIDWLRAGTSSVSHTWKPSAAFCRYPANIHANIGETLRLPKFSFLTSHFSLLERRGTTYIADYNSAVSSKDGFMEISGLGAGDYDLFLKDSNVKIRIKLTKGDDLGGVIAGNRILETPGLRMLAFRKIEVDKNSIRISFEGTSEFTRLHLIATRFMPNFSVASKLAINIPEPFEILLMTPQSFYVAGRDIGDEYRYILDRKYAQKFPGNMLMRPELLLNPWSVRKTETATDTAAAGEGAASYKPMAKTAREKALREDMQGMAQDVFSSMNFLADGAVILPNLKPDEKGQIVIDRKLLGYHQQVHLLAADTLNTLYQEISLPEVSVKKRDLRLAQASDSKKSLTEQRHISVINSGEKAESRGESAEYNSIARVYQLMLTLNNNPDLQEFNFILRWNDSDDKQKREWYSKYACHELNLFLYHKDKKFFDEVILPHLRYKKDKTFMDLWLIGDNLETYLTHWAFSRLNTAEKILLARRLPKERERILKHIRQQFEMLAQDNETWYRLFDIALSGRAFDAEAPGVMQMADSVGETEEMDSDLAMDESAAMKSEARTMAAPAPPPMMAQPAAEPEAMKDKKQRAIGGKDFFKGRAAERKAVRRFFRSPDKTQEWAENNYWHLPIESQNADLIKINPFWNEYANSDPQKPFLSGNFVYAAGNFTEMMLVLAVLDLPITGCVKCDVASVKNPVIIFHKEIREAAASEEKIPVMVTRSIFRADDRYRYEGNEKFDKFVQDEFLLDTAYGCQFLISNPTSSRRRFTAFLQIPEGAIPLNKGFYGKGIPIVLEPYSNQLAEYYFYFPEIGSFKQAPVRISKDEKIVASTQEIALKVVAQPSQIDKSSWQYVSQNGSDKEVLNYLDTHNLNRTDLSKIAFRMKERSSFNNVISLLENQAHFNALLWSYSIYHNDAAKISEYLKHSDYAARCGMYIDTTLLKLDPVERQMYQHLEYKPLINARVHRLGKGFKILNDRFYEQYHRFMTYMSYRPKLDDADKLAICYYLLLQDRMSNAISFFQQIDKAKLETKMQYDYIQVYLDVTTGNLERAKAVAAGYSDYPAAHWREKFQEAMAQFNLAQSALKDQREPEISSEPSFEVVLNAGRIEISYRNLSQCRISYYPMDIELLFSRHPFMRQQTEDFSFIRPNETSEIALPSDKNTLNVDIADKFKTSNVMIEIVAGGIKKAYPYYANTLDVQMIETYGHLIVSHVSEKKPLAKTYIKVYAKMKDGFVNFYKDGYTDFRGRFDYASVSTDDLDRVEKFAILILSEEYGGLIREASPPKR